MSNIITYKNILARCVYNRDRFIVYEHTEIDNKNMITFILPDEIQFVNHKENKTKEKNKETTEEKLDK
jgi:hypothetical protein